MHAWVSKLKMTMAGNCILLRNMNAEGFDGGFHGKLTLISFALCRCDLELGGHDVEVKKRS